MLRSESLYYLVEVARNNSFRIASENLHVTQPAISISIKKLEEELGITIFDRTTRSIKLTDAGKQIVEKSQHIIEHLNELEHIKDIITPPVQYDFLKIYTFPALSEGFLSNLLPKLYENGLCGNLVIQDMYLFEMLELVSNDEFAFALAWQVEAMEEDTLPKNVEIQKLYSAKGQIMLSKESNLLSQDVRNISIKSIQKLPLVSYIGGYGINDLLFNIMKKCNVEPKKVITVPNIALFEQVILSGNSAAFGVDLTAWKCINEANRNYLNFRFIPLKENFTFDFNLYYHTNCPKILREKMISMFQNNC